MRKISKVLSTIFLACSAVGLFSGAVISNNEIKDNTVEVKEAKADTPEYLYLSYISYYYTEYGFTNLYVKFFGSNVQTISADTHYKVLDLFNNYSSYGVRILGYDTANHSENIDPYADSHPYMILRIPTSFNFESFEFDLATSGVGTYHISGEKVNMSEAVNGKDMFIYNSYREYTWQSSGTQKGFWTYYNPNTVDGYDMYFAPSYTWCRLFRQYEHCWPYLVMYNSSGTVLYEVGATEVTVPNADILIPSGEKTSATSKRYFVYHFANIPHNVNADNIYIFKNRMCYRDWKYGYLLLDNTAVSNWNNGLYNLYSAADETESNDTAISYTSHYYSSDKTKTFIAGSFAEYSNIDLPATVSQNNYCAKQDSVLGLSNNELSITLTIAKGDTFRYINDYDYLDSRATSSGTYGYTMENFVRHDFTSDENTEGVIVYNGSTKVNKANWAGYISYASNIITFEKAAKVKIVFEKADPEVVGSYDKVYLKFLTEEREHESTDPSYGVLTSVIGVVSNQDFGFVYDYTVGCYQVAVAVLGGESLVVFDENDGAPTVTRFNANGTGATYSGSTITLPSSTDFYYVGWYPYNSNTSTTGSRGVELFVKSIAEADNRECPIALGKATEPFFTCSCTTANAQKFATLFAKLPSGQTSIDNMKTVTFNDYDYVEYVINGNDYTGLTKKASGATNGYNKYLWIQYLHNNDGTLLPPVSSVADINSSLVYQESNNVIVIVVASISAFAIVSLGIVNFLIIRKKKRNSVSK